MVERLRLPSLRPWPPWASRRNPALLPPLNLSWVWKFALWGENLRRGEGGCCGKWATSWIRMAGRRGTSLVLMLTCLAASTAGRVLFQWCLARNAVALFVCCSFYINPQWKCCIKQSEIIISKENRESVLVNRSYIFRDNDINSMACRGTEVMASAKKYGRMPALNTPTAHWKLRILWIAKLRVLQISQNMGILKSML